MPFPSKAKVERLLALPTPPSSPLISLSPPFVEERLARCLAAPALLSSPLPIVPHPYASLFIPPPVDRREDIPEVELLPCKRLCLTALTSRYKVGESLTVAARPTKGHRVDYGFIGTLDDETRCQRAEEVGYGIRDVWVDPIEAVEEVTPTTLEGVNARVTKLAEIISPGDCVVDGVGGFSSREAWTQSAGLSLAVHQELQAYRTHTQIQDYRIASQESLTATLNNMPLKRTSAAARAAAAAAPMTAAAVEQLIKARVLRHLLIMKLFKIALMVMAMEVTILTLELKELSGCVVSMVQEDGISVLYQQLCCGEPNTKEDDDSQNYPRHEIKKLEIKLWNLKVNGNDVASYTLRFQELALMCGRMFHEESDEVEKYVSGLPDMIRGNKRKLEFNVGNNQRYQQQNKRQNTRRAYTAVPSEKREYTGLLPLGSGPNGNNNNHGNSGMTQNAGTCYECCVQGHFKRDCPKLKNRNHGNQGGNGNASAKVYVVGNAGTNPESNTVTGTFLLNNRYASFLFDTCADRSFVSTTFSSLIDITPSTLDHYYDVKLAGGKITRINTIIWGCTLNFLDHPFHINLMLVELGSFDVIIGMDWLAKYHAIIDCTEKIVRIPWGNETLIVHGDGSNRGNKTRLNIISCTKTHKYMLKGHHVFLAHVTTKETEDKSGEKRLDKNNDGKVPFNQLMILWHYVSNASVQPVSNTINQAPLSSNDPSPDDKLSTAQRKLD
ncbi:reverse transcriptase domain-containing protein [Tanacetum coccineum]